MPEHDHETAAQSDLTRPGASAGASGDESARGLGLSTIPARFLLLYPAVFMLPFPLTLLRLLRDIPGYSESWLAGHAGWLMGLHADVTRPAVAWLGRTLTGEDPSFEFTGSGDGLASYLGVLLDACVAFVLAIAWWSWRRSARVSPRVADAYRVALRYYVAWVMLSYGLSKVFPVQFSVMGPDRIIQPYGDSSPMGLLWTFMGASPGYQMFAGAAEVLGSLLLFFRRTALLGALIVVAVMANVFAMNMFFDVPVKFYSLHYLVFAGLVVLPDLRRLIRFFLTNKPIAPADLRPFWGESRTLRVVLDAVKIALICALFGTGIDSRIDRMKASGLWAPSSELKGIYRVESFEVSGADRSAEPASDSIRWARVGISPPWVATILRAGGKGHSAGLAPR
jgi:hypothetical protein